MLIGGDDISNDVITLGTCLHVFFNVCLHSRSFPLLANWRKSDSFVDGESQGNWRWNSNFRDVVASSPSFSPPRRQSAPQTLLAGYVFFDAIYERCICCAGVQLVSSCFVQLFQIYCFLLKILTPIPCNLIGDRVQSKKSRFFAVI